MYAIKLFTILAALPAIMALPTTTLNKRIDANTQSCTCSDRGIAIGAYSITIGITYANGIGCDAVYNELETNQALAISSWQCVDDGSGNTQLWFNAPLYNGAGINAGLANMYPTVNSFNCPDY